MNHLTKEHELLYVFSMGKKLRVTAIFDNADEANAHMERHRDDAVIAVFGAFIFLANKYDKG